MNPHHAAFNPPSRFGKAEALTLRVEVFYQPLHLRQVKEEASVHHRRGITLRQQVEALFMSAKAEAFSSQTVAWDLLSVSENEHQDERQPFLVFRPNSAQNE